MISPFCCFVFAILFSFSFSVAKRTKTIGSAKTISNQGRDCFPMSFDLGKPDTAFADARVLWPCREEYTGLAGRVNRICLYLEDVT
jgi:hypothetical protein